MYLYRNWSLSKEAAENARQFTDLAKDLFENYVECKELFITTNIVENVMRVVEQVYDEYSVAFSITSPVIGKRYSG